MVKRGNSEGNWKWNYNQPKQRNKHGRRGASLSMTRFICIAGDTGFHVDDVIIFLNSVTVDCMRANWEHQTANESLLSCCDCYHDSSHGIYAALFNFPALFVGENQFNSKAHPSDVLIEKKHNQIRQYI